MGLADVSVAADLMVRLDGATRALADAGAACVLSGGLDSAMLVALLARAGRLTAAYTLAADSDDDAELTRAFASAAHAGVARHRVVTVSDERLAERFADAVRAIRAPVINGKAVATFLLLEALHGAGERRFLSGLGADEVLVGDAVGQACWCHTLDDDAALAATLEQAPAAARAPLRAFEDVLPTLTLPPTVNAAATLGLHAGLPYLEARVVDWARTQPLDVLERNGLGKWPLRSAARGLVPESLRLLPKAPRLAPPAGGARARGLWSDLLAAWLAPARVARLAAPTLDPDRVTALRDQHAALDHRDRELPRLDRVLLGVASRVVLAEAVAESTPCA